MNGYQYINDSYDCIICEESCTSSTCDEGPRTLPWTQDLDADENETGDIWESWDVTLRDLVFLDRQGNYVTRINLTSYNPDPIGMRECTDNYATIKQLILDLRQQ